MLNIFQRFFLFFIFLNTIFSMFAMQNEQEIVHNEILKIVTTALKNDKFEYDNVEKIKNFITEGHIDPNFKINIQPCHLQRLEQIPLLHLAVAYNQADLTNFLLESGAHINNQNGKTTLDVLLCGSNLPNTDRESSKARMIIFKDLLKHRADVNVGNYTNDHHLLKNAIIHSNMLAILNDNGVMINKQNSQILLQETIKNSLNYKKTIYSKTIKDLLYYTDASIDIDEKDTDNTIFHSIASNVNLYVNPYFHGPETAINTMQIILTHAHPQDWTQTIKLLLLKFNQYNFPKDVIRLVFSKLPEEYFKNSSGLLYKIVYPNEYQKYYTIQTQIENRVEWIKEILKKKNIEGKTASYILSNRIANYVKKNNICYFDSFDAISAAKLKSLIDGSQLTNDYNAFKQNGDILNFDYGVKSTEGRKKWETNLVYQMIQLKTLTLMQAKN